jgi:hypothetical protein
MALCWHYTAQPNPLSHNYLFTFPALPCTTQRSTMTIAKQNPTHQRQQQPLTLFSLSTEDLGLPVHITPKSRRDPIAQRAFMRSILEQAIEIANDAEDFFSENSSPDNTNGDEEENSRSQNQHQ